MSYSVSVPRRVQKQINRFPASIQDRINLALRSLGEHPRPPGSRLLSARTGEWRIRVGDYRVIYEIDDTNNSILILEVWHRQRGY